MQEVNRVAIEAAISKTKNMTSRRLTEIEAISQRLLNGMRVDEARQQPCTQSCDEHAPNRQSVQQSGHHCRRRVPSPWERRLWLAPLFILCCTVR